MRTVNLKNDLLMKLMFSAFLVFINRDGHEIAVVYFREGYDPSNYTSENVCPVLVRTVMQPLIPLLLVINRAQ